MWKHAHVCESTHLQSQSDRNGAAFASHVGLHAPDALSGFPGGAEVGVLGVGHPGPAAVEKHASAVVGRAALLVQALHVVDHELAHLVRMLVRHEADRELADHAPRYHSFRASAVERALQRSAR